MATPDNLTNGEFGEAAMRPDFPDSMNFQLDKTDDPDPDRTFSVDGIATIARQIEAFMLARAQGHWTRDGKAPKQMLATVTLRFGDEAIPQDVLAEGLPWYSAVDGESRAKP